MDRNVALYPWFRFTQNLLFWQAVWFLYFQAELSAGEAILLYAVYELATTACEVPSGYASDRLGRRATLVIGAALGLAGGVLLALGGDFAIFAAGNALLGAGMAFASGTDSAILFESLRAVGREGEVEAQELRGWRAGFAGLAASAVLGGALSLLAFPLAFWATAAGFLGSLGIALAMVEPARDRAVGLTGDLGTLFADLCRPALAWLFCAALLAYIYGHVLFVFGQPYILVGLSTLGFAGEAPLVTGVVAALMMTLSLGASLAATALRARLRLDGLILGAFAAQIGLLIVLAASDAPWIVALLLLQKLPSPFLLPLIRARSQAHLSDRMRATFHSTESLVSRLLFAGSLALAAAYAGDVSEMSRAALQWVLAAYAALGLLAMAALALTSRAARIDE
ncbi:MAG: MFS transporter [Pseudomonadota bacterium]